MIVHTSGRYAFELSSEERDKLQQAIEVIREIVKLMKDKSYDTIKSGYDDCPYYYSLEELESIEEKLHDIKSAWEIS